MRITLLNDCVDIVIPKNSFFFSTFKLYNTITTHVSRLIYMMFFKNRRYTHTHINNFPLDKTNLEIQQHLTKSAIITYVYKLNHIGASNSNSRCATHTHKMITSIYISSRREEKKLSRQHAMLKNTINDHIYLSIVHSNTREFKLMYTITIK